MTTDDSCAFPPNSSLPFSYSGMSLRAYFVGQALAGLAGNSALCGNDTEPEDMKLMPILAVKFADAALRAMEES